jgi:hypothetical protein
MCGAPTWLMLSCVAAPAAWVGILFVSVFSAHQRTWLGWFGVALRTIAATLGLYGVATAVALLKLGNPSGWFQIALIVPLVTLGVAVPAAVFDQVFGRRPRAAGRNEFSLFLVAPLAAFVVFCVLAASVFASLLTNLLPWSWHSDQCLAERVATKSGHHEVVPWTAGCRSGLHDYQYDAPSEHMSEMTARGRASVPGVNYWLRQQRLHAGWSTPGTATDRDPNVSSHADRFCLAVPALLEHMARHGERSEVLAWTIEPGAPECVRSAAARLVAPARN